MSVVVHWMGRLGYGEAWAQQKALVADLNQCPEQYGDLLLLEHPPTYTLGRNGHRENLLLSAAELEAQGISFHHVDRGGDITYHGPGQLVGYPILNLKHVYKHYGLGFVRRYVDDLEAMLIHALAQFGLEGQQLENHRGVWLETAQGLAKVAAIGVRISSGGITSHGFALNVAPNMAHFQGIVPCGITDHGVTSMAEHLSHPITVEDVLPEIAAAFQHTFHVPITTHTPVLSAAEGTQHETPLLEPIS